ncbi:hypothetical protein O4214_08915 [Rhodococcus erythropolis]|uniref:hypothetical protein n=1 Tax=Rhodococcus erythropolis TaxID=1833 RepID=UPI001E637699|nr:MULTISPECIES: hypothetical protein [Rhodococcus erythropolis group]MCD2105301.1 hypothetical protein [Rhodococcus qingshengii]MCZ4524095.1 hypothetical protein [Rhodococcus erythropolis]
MFGFYVTALFVSGIGVIVLALVTSELHPGRRVVNGLIGTAFLSYGIYLAVFFHSGEYRIFLWVFILPFILLGQAMRTVEVPAPPGASSPDLDDHLVDPAPAPARTAATRERMAAAKSAQLEALRAKHAAKSDEFDDHAPSTPA